MKSLETMEYVRNKPEPTCLIELNCNDFHDFSNYIELPISDFLEILTTKYANYTFCIQTDYDYMFGNISWQKSYFYYTDAENAILEDWAARDGQPHHTIDKSFISIYQFSELKDCDNMTQQIILQELLNERLK